MNVILQEPEKRLELSDAPGFMIPVFSKNALEILRPIIQNSIESHKISDVEVGSFLSSGVDSSYVAACFNGDKTFTVGFDYEKYNEIDYASEFSKSIGVKHISKIISADEYFDNFANIQKLGITLKYHEMLSYLITSLSVKLLRFKYMMF